METTKDDLLKKYVVNGAKAIFKKKLVDIGEGNVSIRVPNKMEFLMTPTFNQYERMTKDDVIHLTFDGEQLSQGKKTSTEYRLHSGIYRIRQNANCIIHTHSPYATMLSILRRDIPILMEEMVILLGGPIKVSEFAIAHTDNIAKKAVRALNKTNGILLANHGVLVCGRNMLHTVKMAEVVEKMAQIYWGALQISEPYTISKEACVKLMDDFNSNFSTY